MSFHPLEYSADAFCSYNRYRAKDKLMLMSLQLPFLASESMADYYALFNHFPQLVTVRNLKTNEVYVNPAVSNYVGLSGTSHAGLEPMAYIHPEDAQLLRQEWMKLVDGKQAVALSYRIRNVLGQYEWHMGTFTLLRDEEGAPLYRIVISTNIHQQKTKELEVQQNEERLRVAISATHNAMWDYNVLTDQSLYAPEVAEMFELQPGENFNYQKVLAIMHPDDRERITAENNNLLYNPNGPTESVGEYRVIKKDGRIRWYRTACRVLINEQGLRYRMVGMVNDITEARSRQEELETLRNRLELALASTRTAWWDFDIATMTMTSSPLLNEFFGLKPDEAFTVEVFENALHPDDREWVMRKNLDLLSGVETDQNYHAQYRIKVPGTDEYRWILATGKLFTNEEGKPARFIGMDQDITAEKILQAQKDRMQQQLELVSKASQVLLWIADENGESTFVNDMWEVWTGLPVEGNMSSAWQGRIHPDDFQAVMQRIGLAFEQQQPYSIEYRIKNKRDQWMWVRTDAMPIQHVDGRFAGMAGSTTDITAIKLSELQALQNEEQFRELANLIPQLVWTTGPDGLGDWQNTRWKDFFGDYHRGNKWIELLHPDDVQHTMDTWFEAVKTGEPYQIEYRFYDRVSDTYRWFLGKAVPVKDEQGNIIRWVGTCTDIESQKELKDNLDAAWQMRTRELLRLNEQLKRSNDDLQQFAHITSHDMKEPLRKISIFTSQLENRFGKHLQPEANDLIEKIKTSSMRVSQMVESILNYSLVNHEDLTEEVVSLEQVMAEVKEDLAMVIEQKQAAISCEALPTVQGNSMLLYQLFSNLVNNALKFSKQDVPARICIQSKPMDAEHFAAFQQLQPGLRYTEIQFSDNGIGFESTYAEHIFKAFTRLHSKQQFEGTGLGLALCQKIVQRHGGHIYATGKPGEGATFHIFLPLTKK